MVLLKSVLNNISFYWETIVKILEGILSKIRKLNFQFLWRGKKESGGIPMVKWSHISLPNELGGLSIKNILCFFKSLAAKSVWFHSQ
jgi:hypothetical protein